MKRALCTSIALLMLLTACSAPTQAPSGDFTRGIYEFTFSVECLSGWPFGGWDFVYTYNGEEIKSGHQVLLSLEMFSFYAIQVEVIERGTPNNRYSITLRVPICDSGCAKTEITVTDRIGFKATFRITCQVTQVGKQ